MIKNTIFPGDVIDVIKTLLAKSVNCIITSPPYWNLRDYNLPPTNWPVVTYAPMDGLPEITISAMSCCLGLEDSIEAYVGHMVLVFRELWRVLRPDGVAWLNLGDSYSSNSSGQNGTGKTTMTGGADLGTNNLGRYNKQVGTLKPKNLLGIPWRVCFALQADGWYLRSEIIWHKLNPMPESCRDRPTKAHEQVFLLTKNARYWYDQDAIREPNKPYPYSSSANDGETKGPPNAPFNGQTLYNLKGRAEKNTIFNPSGRNKRTVWSLSSQSYKGAHFAVIPPKLVEPCLLAGCPSRVCVECGQPWVKVVQKTTEFHGGSGKAGRTAAEVNSKGKWAGKQYGENIKLGPVVSTKITGFTPTCECSAPHRPGVVLDPFFGSGTVAEVAIETGRYWLGIELNPDYAELARERISKTQSALFARS